MFNQLFMLDLVNIDTNLLLWGGVHLPLQINRNIFSVFDSLITATECEKTPQIFHNPLTRVIQFVCTHRLHLRKITIHCLNIRIKGYFAKVDLGLGVAQGQSLTRGRCTL